MRRSAILLAIAVAACSSEQEAGPAAVAEAVACAHGPDGGWTMSCRLERSEQDDRDLLVVQRADGAFRRLVVLADGSGVAAADGAAQVVQRRVGGLLEVSVGDDRYRVPFPQGPVR